MKSNLRIVLFIVLVMMLFAGCNDGNRVNTTPTGGAVSTPAHAHSFSPGWSNDEEYHWHAATCEHTERRGSLNVHEDADEDGNCDVCAYGMRIFTVTLRKDYQPYSPEIEMYARWTDGQSYYTAKFDENGVASISGLDGDYMVTLSAVPLDYVYNTNGYRVSNDTPDITINLVRFSYGDGSPGTGPYYPEVLQMEELGVYQIEIEDADDKFYCRFRPARSGTYVIESWISIVDDDINPKVELYQGTVSHVQHMETIDGGGWESENGYTKNFRFVIEISNDEVGSAFVFAISATSKDGSYPIMVPFCIERVYDLPV